PASSYKRRPSVGPGAGRNPPVSHRRCGLQGQNGVTSNLRSVPPGGFHQGKTAMIEIDPEAEYTPAQVASLLNMPESQIRGLWQEWPVCGFDVLGYCHR